jgi:excinuclease ABC subunit C
MDAADAAAGVRLSFADADLGAALLAVPTAAGVAQILGRDGRPLLTARAASLRRFALTKLGAPRPAAPGKRPPTDLRPLAAGLRHAVTTSPFHQRLVFERWMEPLVPPSRRRDLRPPAYLRLDAGERFPRVSVCAGEGSAQALFGPFRDKRAAERALKPLHKLFPLRPCDYAFEPDPALPLGLGCLYAQVRTCAAPCLRRVSEDDYRALARRAAEFLADPEARPDEVREWLPAWVAAAAGAALVVERARRGVELYPVRGGAVLEEHALRCDGLGGDQALARLDVLVDALERAPVPAGRDDRAWLAAHLYARPRTTTYVVLRDPRERAALAAHLRDLPGA